MEKNLDKVHISSVTKISTKEDSEMTRDMVRVLIYSQQEDNSKESGSMMYLQENVKYNSLMVVSMKEISQRMP